MTSPYRVQAPEVCPWCNGTALGWMQPGESAITPCHWCHGTGLASRMHTSPEQMVVLGMRRGWGMWAEVTGGPSGYCLHPFNITGPPVLKGAAHAALYPRFVSNRPPPPPPAGYFSWGDYDDEVARREQQRWEAGY